MTARRAIGRAETFLRDDGRHGWRITVVHAGDEDVVATDGGQGYQNRVDALMVAEKVLHGDYSPVRQSGDYPLPPDKG